MRKIVYICDYCEREFGNKRHLSISFGDGWSGFVEPDKNGTWKHVANALRSAKAAVWELNYSVDRIKHFCSTRCLGKYFLRGNIGPTQEKRDLARKRMNQRWAQARKEGRSNLAK